MIQLKHFLFCLIIFALQSGTVLLQCVIKDDGKGVIFHSFANAPNVSRNYQRCWEILNPSRSILTVNVKQLQLNGKKCEYGSLRLKNNQTGYYRDICGENFKGSSSFTTTSDIDILFRFNSYYHPYQKIVDFIITYETANNMTDIQLKVTNWLLEKRVPAWGWKKNNPKSIIALYLSSNATFNGSKIEEELMVKQGELSVAAALLNSPIPNEELSSLINSMLVVCHSPYNFLSHNLVKRLYNQIENSTGDFVHPVNYLTLCNANMTWPENASQDLTKLLNNESEFPFITDMQAFAIMALSCEMNRTETGKLISDFKTLHEKVLKRLEQKQLEDGSFGSVQTTALITQAFMSAESERNWNKAQTLNYLRNELDSSIDFVTAYLALPIFNGRTLVDITKVNCSGNPRNIAFIDPTVTDDRKFNMKIQYSLYIGDEKDNIHSTMLQVPQNSSAFNVMKLAQAQNPKFKFEWKNISGSIYVYSISEIPNDSEAGKMWLLYVGKGTSDLSYNSTSPDKVLLQDGNQLVMWYRTAKIQ